MNRSKLIESALAAMDKTQRQCYQLGYEAGIIDGKDAGGWISVEDRLPDCDKDVLMLFDNGNMAVGGKYELGDDGWYSITDADYYTDCETKPMHWMPLPAPPEV